MMAGILVSLRDAEAAWRHSTVGSDSTFVIAVAAITEVIDTVVVLKTVTIQRPFEKKAKNLQMEADRLELIARHKFAPSNRPRLFARPVRVQIVLGARLYPAWFTHGRWPVPFRAAGLRGRRNRQ
jgi:hypothetical protein